MEQLYADSLRATQPTQLASVSFPGSRRKTPPTGAWLGFGRPAPADPGPALFLTPLSAADGREIQPANSPYVYRVANLAGLWQFKGLHPDIDSALDIIWQAAPDRAVLFWNSADQAAAAWTATVPAAMTLPHHPDYNGLAKCPWWLEPSPDEMSLAQVRSELTLGNASLLDDVRGLAKSDRNEIIAWIEQLSSEEVYKRLDKQLDQIEANAKAESKAPLAQAVGYWDVDRLRWLRQWFAGMEMN